MSAVGVRLLARGALALVLLLAGGVLLYFAVWLTWSGVLPQVRRSGPSLTDSNLILNRDWRGNQLYLLIALYAAAGGGLAAAAAALWRRRPKRR